MIGSCKHEIRTFSIKILGAKWLLRGVSRVGVGGRDCDGRNGFAHGNRPEVVSGRVLGGMERGFAASARSRSAMFRVRTGLELVGTGGAEISSSTTAPLR